MASPFPGMSPFLELPGLWQSVHKRLIVAIADVEILSPKNKRAGEGRRQYLEKRNQVLASSTHFVGIDLLHAEKLMPIETDQSSDYRILVSRSEQRPQASLYLFGIRDRIPAIPLPLLSEADMPEPSIDLQVLLHEIYERGSYDLAIDYHSQLVPRLLPEDETWVNTLIRKANL